MDKRGLLDLIISQLSLSSCDRIKLLEGFECENDFISISKKDVDNFLGHHTNCHWNIDEIRTKAQNIETLCMMRSIYWVSWSGASYPPQLREMYDPPAVLFYRGILPNPQKPLLAIVGTRHPSPEAAIQAYSIASQVGQAGISVVSGLALGIDAMAHRGNASSFVPGYAVLGSGVDEIYPSTNRMLARRILDSGGAVISEYPPGTRPAKWNFPARNRIISALSRSVIIVEAPKKSGALITAAFALEQGRDLWVASSGLQEQQYSSLHDKLGTIKLAGDGAEIIYSARDVLEKWNIDFTYNDDNNEGNSNAASWDACGKELAANMADYLEIDL